MLAVLGLALLVFVETQLRATHRQNMAAVAADAAKRDAEYVDRLREAWCLGFVRRDDETEAEFLLRFDARHIPNSEVSRDVR